jgi:hypothetical protein
MNDIRGDAPNVASMRWRARLGLTCLLGFHILACCLSLIYVAKFYAFYKLVWFDQAHLYAAVLNIALFALVSIFFTFSRFSFGYFLGFYFYTTILGYLWLVEFSKFPYDHTIAVFSAFVSAVAFLAPALFITSQITQRFVLSEHALDNVLSAILIFAATIIAVGTFHNFRLVGLGDIYDFRGELKFPGWLRYAIGTTSNALLPFAFACFVARRKRWRAAAALLLLLLFYPITLTKLVLFAPFWLLFLTLLSRFFDAKTSVVLSLFLPISFGVILALPVNAGTLPFEQIMDYFGAINFRMIAIPSIAIDLYSDFFSTHHRTHFCQVLFLKPFVECPYVDPLSVLMANAYQFGNLNASLFATEGIASVGPILAPLAVFMCGLVISLANRLSSGLPPRFILLSGGILPQIFLNVPATTTLLSNGAALLFLLWYITPRTMFEPKADQPFGLTH